MIPDLDGLVGAAVAEVFTTMLSFDVSLEAPPAGLTNGEMHIASSVGFIGQETGVIYLYSTCSFARTMTSRLLGVAEPDVEGEEMVNDAMGELANMIVGHMKSRLSDRGMPCVLTIPSIVRGSHLCIEPTSSTRRKIYSFRCHGSGYLTVEALLKPAE